MVNRHAAALKAWKTIKHNEMTNLKKRKEYKKLRVTAGRKAWKTRKLGKRSEHE